MFPNQFRGFSPFGGGGPWGNPFMPQPPSLGPGHPWFMQQRMQQAQQAQQAQIMRFQMQQQQQQQQQNLPYRFRPRGEGQQTMISAPTSSTSTSNEQPATLSSCNQNERGKQKASYWMCETCRSNNWLDRLQCFKCKADKPGGKVSSQVIDKKEQSDETQTKALLSQENQEKPQQHPQMSLETMASSKESTCNQDASTKPKPRQSRWSQQLPQDEQQQPQMSQAASSTSQPSSVPSQKQVFASKAEASTLRDFRPANDQNSAESFKPCKTNDVKSDNSASGQIKSATMGQKKELVKPGDWKCSSCNYVNFAFRRDCNKCRTVKPKDLDQSSAEANAKHQGQSTKLAEHEDRRQQDKALQPGAQQQQQQKQLQARSMSQYSNHKEYSDIEQFQEQDSSISGTSLTKQASRFAKEENRLDEFFLPRRNRGNNLAQDRAVPTSKPIINASNDSPSKAGVEQKQIMNKEAEFDKMFDQWEKNFAFWKLQNENNPDKDYVQMHIYEMNQLREKMITRRESLRQQRCALLAQEVLIHKDLQAQRQSSNVPTRDGPGSRWRSLDQDNDCRIGDEESSARYNFGAWDNDKEQFSKHWERSEDVKRDGKLEQAAVLQKNESYPSYNYLKRKSDALNDGIPGLGDGKDTEESNFGTTQKEREQEDTQKQLSRQDLEAISRSVRALERPNYNKKRTAISEVGNRSQFSWSQNEEETCDNNYSLWLRRNDVDFAGRSEFQSNSFGHEYRQNADAGFNSGNMFERRDDVTWNPHQDIIDFNVSAAKQPKVIDYTRDAIKDGARAQPKVIDYSHGGNRNNRDIGGFGDESRSWNPNLHSGQGNEFPQHGYSAALQQNSTKTFENRQIFDYNSVDGNARSFEEQPGNSFPRPVPSSLQLGDKSMFDYEGELLDTRVQVKRDDRVFPQTSNFPRPVPSAQTNRPLKAENSTYGQSSFSEDGYRSHGSGGGGGARQIFDYESSRSRDARNEDEDLRFADKQAQERHSLYKQRSDRDYHATRTTADSWREGSQDDRDERSTEYGSSHGNTFPASAPKLVEKIAEKIPAPPPPPSLVPPPPNGELVQISDLLEPPGRYVRPPKIVIILRGLPGSGKSSLCKNIKAKETELGSDAPRVLCLDDYFECDGEYEYEAALEDNFRASLVKSFKKQIDDGYFTFMIVDGINDKTKYYQEMWSYAKQRGFEVYIAELDCDPGLCFSRNIHGRTKVEIQQLYAAWEPTPVHFNRADVRGFLQDKEINDVVMEVEESEAKEVEVEDKAENEEQDEEEENAEDNLSHFKLSKWEVMDNDLKMAQLDGVSARARKRVAEHDSIEDWLEMSTRNASSQLITGKKRVRWADIEEQRAQMKMREVGFVVGQTNWNRMLDPSQGVSALTQTKIIPNRFDYH